MEIVEVDASTAPDALLEQVWVVETEAGADALGKAPAPTLEERLARYRNPGPYRRRRFLAYVDDDAAALGALEVFGPAFAIGDVLVRPAFRRRGVGRALFEHVCATARQAGVPSFFGHHASPPGAAFAAAMGAQDDQRDVKSHLDLRTAHLPDPTLPDGTGLRTWDGAVPEELLESFVRARSAMNDAPAPGGAEDMTYDAEQQRADDAALMARGTPPHTTVAIDRGEIVALTGIRVGPPPCPYVTTDDTAVIASHRGRGLAYAVKLENLRTLRDARPDVEGVGTMNAEHNVAMRAVNTKLGFVPTVYLTTSVVTL